MFLDKQKAHPEFRDGIPEFRVLQQAANKCNHSIIVTQSVLTYHVVSCKLPLIIRLIVHILHCKFNGHHTIRIMQQYVWTRLIRIECEYREFDFNANRYLNSCE